MKPLSSPLRWTIGLVLFVLAVEMTAAWIAARWSPDAFSDESHFLATVELFSQGLNLDTLKTYDEMSTPLPFVIYAAWGWVFGVELLALRLLSGILAIATCVVLFRWFTSVLASERLAFLAACFVVLHPYMLALGSLVYTDITAMLFLAVSLVMVRQRRPVLLAIALAAAVLSRQYLIYLTLATALTACLRIWAGNDRRGPAMLAACILSLGPLLALVLLWRGLVPINERAARYFAAGFEFHPNSLVLYVSLCSIYLLPVVAWRWRTIYGRWRLWVATMVVCWTYWLFPVEASQVAVREGLSTVGLFHRVLAAFESQVIEQAVFFAGFVLGLPVVFAVIADLGSRARRRQFDDAWFLDLVVVCFLSIMPWSYLHWEKYFMPLVPVLLARMLMMQDVAITIGHDQETQQAEG